MWFEVKSSFGLMHAGGFGLLTVWTRKGVLWIVTSKGD